jgi:hypothetical protein
MFSGLSVFMDSPQQCLIISLLAEQQGGRSHILGYAELHLNGVVFEAIDKMEVDRAHPFLIV